MAVPDAAEAKAEWVRGEKEAGESEADRAWLDWNLRARNRKPDQLVIIKRG